MKNNIILLVLMFIATISTAQKEAPTKKTKDTIIKTEVVNVVTSYAPKVTDAFKIKRKPIIQLSKDVSKKKLQYNIISVPVASTFIPQSGTLKGIKVEKRERLFHNYISGGIGNSIAPFLNGYFHKSIPFNYEYGIGLNFISSTNPVENTLLSSSFYNIGLDLFYKKEQYQYTWKAGLKAKRNKYNWYGLPTNINFTNIAINTIDESQVYNSLELLGNINVLESYIEDTDVSVGYFYDAFNNYELNADMNSTFALPLNRIRQELDDLKIKTSFEVLGGKFKSDYHKTTRLRYGFISASVNPSYQFHIAGFDIEAGVKTTFSMNLRHKTNQFLLYPDVKVNFLNTDKTANLYVGITGGLNNNSYKNLSEKNPYMSPTAKLLQTNEAVHIFGGSRGVFTDDINYGIKISFKNEKNKALFSLNPSKSDGESTGIVGGDLFFGYEYGNSFNVVYDDIKTSSIFAEVGYDAGKNFAMGVNGEINFYTPTTQKEAWHLPKIKAEFFTKYKADKWYAGSNIYFVGNRKGLIIDKAKTTIIDLDSYVDINLNGGYHFNTIFSVFLKANNITNNKYQRFTNFKVQGTQIIGGVIWKFDTLF